MAISARLTVVNSSASSVQASCYADKGTIDWGDGTVTPYTTTVHTYTSSGTFIIEVHDADTVRITPENGSSYVTAYTKIEFLTVSRFSSDFFDSFGEDFYGASGITEVVLPNSMTGKIRTYCFRNCSSLRTFVVPEGITELGLGAFAGCSSLSAIQIPGTVRTIGMSAFLNCSALKDVYFTGSLSQWQRLRASGINSQFGGNDYFLNAKVHIGKELSYNLHGGSLQEGFDNPTYVSEFPNPLPTATNGSFLFGGWFTDSNFTQQIVAGALVDQAKTIHAKFYNTVTYVLDGGTNSAENKADYTSIDVDSNRMLYAATKDGYDFAGWFTDPEFATSVTGMLNFDGSPITLYAKFEPHYVYRPERKNLNGAKTELPLDAKTANGHEPYVNINISSMSTMDELCAKISELNAGNKHAMFDASAFIPGVYVSLVELREQGGNIYCSILDLLHNKSYYRTTAVDKTESISSYIASCTVEDNYSNISLNGLTTMRELREYVNSVNTSGSHHFFDLSAYRPGAYVCTLQMYSEQSVNYCFAFDILDGKLIGSYSGYSDDEVIADYVSGNTSGTESDIVHVVKITDLNTTLQGTIQLLNMVNILGHHVLLDVSELSGTDYLITFTFTENESGVLCRAVGLVNGTIINKQYTSSELEATTLASFLTNNASGIATQDDLSAMASSLAIDIEVV